MRLALAVVLGIAAAPAAAAAPPGKTACLAGTYDGGQTEIAAGLELRADGRFAYGLSYGALDEQAEGRWEADDAHVYLTSDPVVAPAYALIGSTASPDGAFHVALDVPEGLSRQYFDAALTFADGRKEVDQFDEEGFTRALAPGEHIVAVQVQLPIVGVGSDTVPLTGDTAQAVHFSFAPNDLGKVAFEHEALAREKGELLVQRLDRSLRFRPVEGGCGAGAAP